MSTLALLLALLIPQNAEPQTTQPAPTLDKGPLEAHMVAMQELRRWAEDPNMAARMPLGLQLTFRLQGEGIDRLSRYSNLVFTEILDDSGQQLVEPNAVTEIDKYVTRQTPYPADRLRENGVILPTRVKASDRKATHLKTVRGSVKVVLADAKDSEKITIVNPYQFYGKTIEHPRLKELGVQIAIAPIDQVVDAPQNERGLVLQYKENGEKVQSVTYFDGWMRPVMSHPNWMKLTGGGIGELYHFEMPNVVNDELQLVVEVHPKVELKTLPIQMDNVELP